MAQEGASNGLLEFIEERLRARGRELFPQRVDFGERGAQQPVSLCFLPRFVQLKTSSIGVRPAGWSQAPFDDQPVMISHDLK